MAEYLRALDDTCLLAVAEEADERWEHLTPAVRQEIVDELRRRRLAPHAWRRS